MIHLKKKLVLVLLFILLIAAFSGCKKKNDDVPAFSSNELQFRNPSKGSAIATIETGKGTIKAVLYPSEAPKAVENFITHAENGYYDNNLFHRVVKDFVIQSGDPTETGNGGDSIWKIPFEDEYSDNLHHYRGAIGYANSEKDKNKSQFYIIDGINITENLISQMKDAGFPDSVIEAYKEVGGHPTLDYRYTVFGQVIEGIEVVDEIAALETDKFNRPLDDVRIKTITIEYVE